MTDRPSTPDPGQTTTVRPLPGTGHSARLDAIPGPSLTGRLVVFALVLIFTACGPDDGRRTEPRAATTGGNDTEVLRLTGETAAWRRIDPSASLRLGPAAGHEPFHRVRGAVLLDSGKVVVANGGTDDLMYFGPEGSLLTTVGGPGGGPSEFEQLGALASWSGGVVAFDRRRRRFVRFGPDGRFLAGSRVTGEGLETSALRFAGRTADGRAVLTARGYYGAESRQGVHVDTVAVVTCTVDTAGGGTTSVDTLGAFPGLETYVETGFRGPRSVRTTPRPFSGRLRVAVGDSVVAVAHPRAFEVSVFVDGDERHEIRRDAERRTVDAESKARRIEALRERLGEDPEARDFLSYYRELPFPERMPAIGGLAVDGDGRIWIGAYAPPHAEEPVRWFVVTPDEGLLGTVTLPASFTPTDIRGGNVTGIHQGRLGIERVVVHRLAPARR